MSLIVMAISIQDIWLIEEKAISLRNFVTLRPPKAPIKEESRAAIEIRKIRLEEYVK